VKPIWTPQAIACVALVFTMCIIMLTIEAGVFMRSTSNDVAESRTLLKDTMTLVMGLTAGFFMGKATDKDKDN